MLSTFFLVFSALIQEPACGFRREQEVSFFDEHQVREVWKSLRSQVVTTVMVVEKADRLELPGPKVKSDQNDNVF